MRQRYSSTATRRGLLSITATGMLAGLAGCASDDESAAEGDEDDTDGEPAADTDEGGDDASPETSLNEPVAFPEDAECPVCGMMPADHSKWNAQLVHEDEHREFFDTSGCLAAYVAYTDRFGGPDSELAASWVTGFETGELIDATDAFFVRVSDPKHVDDIMGMNPTPFAERSDAEAFIDEFEEYSEEDIIRFSDFDKELAEFYRGQLINEA